MIRSCLPVVAFELRHAVVAIAQQLDAQAMIVLHGRRNAEKRELRLRLVGVSTYLRNAIEASEKIIQNCHQLLRRCLTCQLRKALEKLSYRNLKYALSHSHCGLAHLDVGKQNAHIVHGIDEQLVELCLHRGIRALVHFAAYLIVHHVGQNCKKE